MRNHCREFAADLDLLAAGVLSSGKEPAVAAHLSGCTECRGRYERTCALCADLAVAGNAIESVEAAAWRLRNRARMAISGTRPHDGGRWLPAAALAGALALLVFVVGKTGSQPAVAPPVVISSVAPMINNPPLTLLACERAAARSDAALDQLLARDAERPLTSGEEFLRSFPPNALAALDQNNRLP